MTSHFAGVATVQNIGQAEWQVMQFIADHHPVGVREVAEQMAESRGLARTSVLTVMERLRNKGHLRRRRRENRWVYSPKLSKSELLKRTVHEFVQQRLQGALSPFVAYMAEQSDVSDEELAELRDLVAQLESQKRARGGKNKGSS